MTQRGWQFLVGLLVAALTLVGLALYTASRADVAAEQAREESDRRWCGVVVALDQAYQESPPQTPAGRQ
ncbi:hypothetical protein, partial [Polymorphospora rubra]